MRYKKLEIDLTWKEHGKTEILVPENLTFNEAVQYARSHADAIVLPAESRYIPESDEIYESKCEFEFDATLYEVEKQDTTCWSCGLKERCKFAFDPYNINDDCLAGK